MLPECERGSGGDRFASKSQTNTCNDSCRCYQKNEKTLCAYPTHKLEAARETERESWVPESSASALDGSDSRASPGKDAARETWLQRAEGM